MSEGDIRRRLHPVRHGSQPKESPFYLTLLGPF